MKLIILWDDIRLIEINKVDKIYIASIDAKNVEKAKKCGLPAVLLSSIKTVSNEIPEFIKARIPDKVLRNKVIKDVSDNEEQNDLRYINITKCRYATDKFKVDIAE